MIDGVIYTRVSSREQEQEGFSLGAQAKLLREYAQKNGIRIVQAFEDVETAKASGRKQFTDMAARLKRDRTCRLLLVEKTDRLYRNFRDAVTLEDLDIEIHLVKEGQIVSKDSKSQSKLIHGIHLVMAKNYSENLREEVKKGMREKAAQGIFPGHAPFGYQNNKAERTIEVDPDDSPIVNRIFHLYASGSHSLKTLRQTISCEFGKKISKGNLHLILKNPFYTGSFSWGGEMYAGTHAVFVNVNTYREAQAVLRGHNRPKHSKRDLAFRGLVHCGYDGCLVTGEIQKEKYIYYRCTGHRGKCALPRFREEDLAHRLGEPLKGLQVPQEVASKIVAALRDDGLKAKQNGSAERARLETRLASIQSRMDAAYLDKLDGKIPEEFWDRKRLEWQAEQQQVRMAMVGLKQAEGSDKAVDAQRIFELASRAYSL